MNFSLNFTMETEELKSFLILNGKIPAKRLTESYFLKHGKSELFYGLMAVPGDYDFRIKVHMALNNLLPTKCKYCDNHTIVTVLGGVVKQSLYCSTACKNIDMSSIMKTALKDIDYTSANKKREETLLKTTGYRFNSQRPELKHFLTKPRRIVPIEIEKFLSDRDWLNEQYTHKKRPAELIAQDLFELTGIRVQYWVVLDYLSDHGIPRGHFKRSKIEIEFEETLVKHGFEVSGKKMFMANRKKEIDIFLGRYNLGIEVNGLYHHSNEDSGKSDQHLWKTEAALEEGIKLIHLTDHQIMNQKDLIISMIKARCGLAEKIHARACSVAEVDTKIAKQFMNDNHISGYSGASVKLGLFYEGDLYSVITMGKPRFDKKYDWEIIRYATKQGYTVVGGFSRLLKNFMKSYPGSIITYADRSYGEGNVYRNSGFEFVRKTSPGYVWTDRSRLYSRYEAQKSNIRKIVPEADLSKTEDEIMFGAGFRKFWNSGNNVFVHPG